MEIIQKTAKIKKLQTKKYQTTSKQEHKLAQKLQKHQKKEQTRTRTKTKANINSNKTTTNTNKTYLHTVVYMHVILHYVYNIHVFDKLSVHKYTHHHGNNHHCKYHPLVFTYCTYIFINFYIATKY